MIASTRLIAKIPTLAAMAYKYTDRPAVRLSEQQPRLHVELPQHVLRGAVRGVQGQPGPLEGAGQDFHSSRRPRAERLHLDRATGRIVGRKPVRVHRGGCRVPLGPGPRRSQRGGA